MKTIKLVLVLLILSGNTSRAQSTLAEKRKAQFNLTDGVAIQGYDPVSYFTENKEVKGSSKFSARAEGILYHFSTEANKALFLKNYSKYEPAYGGWCAYAMGSSGEKVEIDPATFKIIEGKLYLFYNAFFNNTLKTWNKDEVKLKKQADANWNKFY
ncbi:MAG: YHS domain protein [Bacteroidetes bacterium]|nr:YHS domain protein [Bacteroidota bacterium]